MKKANILAKLGATPCSEKGRLEQVETLHHPSILENTKL